MKFDYDFAFNCYFCGEKRQIESMFHLTFNHLRFFIVSMIAIVALSVMSGCRSEKSGKPLIVVTIPPQKYILEQIVVDKIAVKALLAQGANPENYEPGMSHIMDLQRAVAYMTVGNIGFESAILPKLAANNPDLPVIESISGLPLLTGTHGHCGHSGHSHVHNVPDPHTWSSVKNVRVIAANMAEAVEKIDPANKSYYHDRYLAFDSRLDSMDRAIAARLSPLRGKSFLIWHPSLSYFARDYGLVQIAVGQEGKEPSAIELGEKIEKALSNGTALFFYQRDFDSRQASAFNRHLNATVVEINPMNENWEDEINLIVNAFDENK